jgi:hypothetical protein
MTGAGIRFYFDPVCPFAWITSKWVRVVAAQRDYSFDWRFISLRMINSQIDYDGHFPAGYEEGHGSGLRLLRVAGRGPSTAGLPPGGSTRRLAVRSSTLPARQAWHPRPGAAGTSSSRSSPARLCPLTSQTRSTTRSETRRSAPRARKRWH